LWRVAPESAWSGRLRRAAVFSSSEAGGAVDVNRIVRAFTAKETEFRKALNGYRMKVRYADYKVFRGRVRVIEEGDPGDTP
jgi:hypothetical protein